MSIKKLLVDAHTFDEDYHGLRTFLKGIYSTINIENTGIVIYLAANNISQLKEEFKDQKKFKYLNLRSKNKYIRLAYELPRLIRKFDIDFAHFNYFLPLFLNKKCKYIVTIHDVLFIDYPHFFPLKYRIVNTFMFKRSARKADIVTSVSNYSADRITKLFKLRDKKVYILPNAIENKYYLKTDKSISKQQIKDKYNLDNFILYVSRIEPRKNHITLLKAYNELRLWEKDIDLVLIGKLSIKTPEMKLQIDLINKESKGSITMLEDIPTYELMKFYNAALISIYPSLCEGFGIPPLESAVLHTPTICSNATAMKDFDFFGKFLIDMSTTTILKKRIIEILNNYESENLDYRNELEKIANSIKSKYSWEKTSDAFKQLILSNN